MDTRTISICLVVGCSFALVPMASAGSLLSSPVSVSVEAEAELLIGDHHERFVIWTQMTVRPDDPTAMSVWSLAAPACAAGLRFLAAHDVHPPANGNPAEFDPVYGECRALRDALLDIYWQGETMDETSHCTMSAAKVCFAVGHPQCDLALFAANGVVYECIGGINPNN